jgi:hypothetical protein
LAVAKHKYDIDKVGAEIANARALAEAEASFTIDQGRRDVEVKGTVSDLELRIRSDSAMSDAYLTLQDARLTSEANNQKSALKVGHSNALTSLEINGLQQSSFQKITLADRAAEQRGLLLQQKSQLAIAMTQGQAAQNVSNTNVKAILTRSATRGMADDAYIAEKSLTDTVNDNALLLANDELNTATLYNDFVIEVGNRVANYMQLAARAIAVYGSHREHTRYNEDINVLGFPAGLLPTPDEPVVPSLGKVRFY